MVAQPAPQLPLALDGPALRDQALARLEHRRHQWLVAARVVRDAFLRVRDEVSADDIHRLCPIPADIDPRVMGALFRDLERVRYQPSRRPERHACPISVWRKK